METKPLRRYKVKWKIVDDNGNRLDGGYINKVAAVNNIKYLRLNKQDKLKVIPENEI